MTSINRTALSYSQLCLLGFFTCFALLGYAYYEQFAMHVEPCPLCIFQRIAFIAMAVVFLAAALHNPRAGGRRAYAGVLLLAAAIGVGVAARHLWLQSQPQDPMAGCTPGWNYMVENFPIGKVLKMAFTGHADCAQINWTFLGMAMPFWTLVWYVALGVGAIWAGFRRR